MHITPHANPQISNRAARITKTFRDTGTVFGSNTCLVVQSLYRVSFSVLTFAPRVIPHTHGPCHTAGLKTVAPLPLAAVLRFPLLALIYHLSSTGVESVASSTCWA